MLGHGQGHAVHPEARQEAVTSRPRLLAAMGKATSHAGQTQLHLTSLHAKAKTIRTLIANVRAALQHVSPIAEQLSASDPWITLLRYICWRIALSISPVSTPPALQSTG